MVRQQHPIGDEEPLSSGRVCAQADAEKASADLKSTLEEVFGLLLSGVSSSEELASNTLLTIADPMPTSQALLLHSL